jgi:hypothetical protein
MGHFHVASTVFALLLVACLHLAGGGVPGAASNLPSPEAALREQLQQMRLHAAAVQQQVGMMNEQMQGASQQSMQAFAASAPLHLQAAAISDNTLKRAAAVPAAGVMAGAAGTGNKFHQPGPPSDAMRRCAASAACI